MTDIKHKLAQIANHTNGPWFITVNDPQGYSTHHIATVHGVSSQPTEDGKGQKWLNIGASKPCFEVTEEEQEANARLITAAPGMLEALERIVEILPSGSQPWETNSQEVLARETALAAIAEAKGLAA